MIRPTRRLRRLLGYSIVPASLLATGLIVTGSSYAAFSAPTSNAGNSWAVGTVAISDDDSNAAMFTASNLAPGATGTKCIAVTSTGSLASTVKLYGTNHSTTNGLSSHINLTVTQGTGSGFTASNCSGFTALTSNSAVYSGTLANFASTATSYATGLPGSGAWTPTGTASETRVFKFDYTVSSAAPNTTQGGSSSIAFTWEAQNN